MSRDLFPIPDGDTQTQQLCEKIHSIEQYAVDLYQRSTGGKSLAHPDNAENLGNYVREIANLLIQACKDYDPPSAQKIASLVLHVILGSIIRMKQPDDARIVNLELSAELLYRVKVFESSSEQTNRLPYSIEYLTSMFRTHFDKVFPDQGGRV